MVCEARHEWHCDGSPADRPTRPALPAGRRGPPAPMYFVSFAQRLSVASGGTNRLAPLSADPPSCSRHSRPTRLAARATLGRPAQLLAPLSADPPGCSRHSRPSGCSRYRPFGTGISTRLRTERLDRNPPLWLRRRPNPPTASHRPGNGIVFPGHLPRTNIPIVTHSSPPAPYNLQRIQLKLAE